MGNFFKEAVIINTGKPYEKLAQLVFNHINNTKREGVEAINVQHNVELQGKDTKHQIDVYWEFKIGVVTHKVIVQAKNMKSKVKKGQMLNFKGVIADLSGTIGIFVTTQGFQKGALEVAVANGIHIYVLREPIDSDWDGYIKTLNIKLHMLFPVCENFRTVIDENWLLENEICLEEVAHPRYAATRDSYIIKPTEKKKSVHDLILEICDEVGVNIEKRDIIFANETFLEFSNGERFKIKGFRGSFGTREIFCEYTIDGGEMVDVILKNIENSEIHMFNAYGLCGQNIDFENS